MVVFYNALDFNGEKQGREEEEGNLCYYLCYPVLLEFENSCVERITSTIVLKQNSSMSCTLVKHNNNLIHLHFKEPVVLSQNTQSGVSCWGQMVADFTWKPPAWRVAQCLL